MTGQGTRAKQQEPWKAGSLSKIGTSEQYSEGCAAIEGITGYPAFESGTEFNEFVTGVYTADGEEAILEM